MTRLPKDIARKIDDRQFALRSEFKQQLKNQLFLSQEGTMATKKQFSLNTFFQKLNSVSGFAVIAALVVVGSASAFMASNNARVASEKKTSIPASLDGVLSLSEIKTKAMADMPSGTIVNIELENEHGVLVYKVRFADGSFRLYNAKTGQALASADESLEKSDSVPADFVAGISLQQARDAAQAQLPGLTVSKIELEVEDGVTVYSVRFSDGSRVEVNAVDGSIVRVRNAASADSSSSSSDDTSSDDSSGSEDSNDGDDSSNSGSGSSGHDDAGDNPDSNNN